MNVSNKQLSIAGVVVLLLLGLSFAGGRFSAPLHEVTKSVLVVDTTVKKAETLHIVWDVKEVVKVVHDVSTKNNVETKKKTTVLPDGTTTIEESTKDLTQVEDKTDSSRELESHTESVGSKTEDTHQKVEESKTVTIDRERPNWSLSLQPGFDFAGAFGHGSQFSLLPTLPVKHMMLGVSIDRRLIGPLFTGVWANSAGAGGLTIRAEF